jgi:hypothetical protein
MHTPSAKWKRSRDPADCLVRGEVAQILVAGKRLEGARPIV